MSKATIISKARKFNEAVSRTVVETALDIANEVWNTYGDEVTNEVASELANEIDGKVAARTSEWKAFMLAVPYGLPEALKFYPSTGDTLTRVKLFALCRELRKHDFDKYRTTVRNFVKNLGKVKGSKNMTPEQKLGMGLGVIKKIETKSRKVIEFRKALAALCKEYGINY